MASTEFERFRFSFFEDPLSARDGLDTEALAQLAGGERTRAEDMLLDHLPDLRAVIGLGVLRSQRAEPLLVRRLEAELGGRSVARLAASGAAPPYVLAALARALWQIRPDPRWSAVLIDVLVHAREPLQRMDAAFALRDVRDVTVEQALIAALDDDEPLVRHHAARALLRAHGLPCSSDDNEHMLYRVMARQAARRQGGKADILAAIAAAS